MVQLPGVSDYKAAENLIKRTAMLEFKLVAPQDEAKRVIETIDRISAVIWINFPF